MGGCVPNPVAIATAKAVGYSLFGWAVGRKSSRRGNPVGFGIVRLVAGWLVGVALVALLLLLALLGLRLPTPMWSDRQAYLALLVPRFALWAVLIHYWFRPEGRDRGPGDLVRAGRGTLHGNRPTRLPLLRERFLAPHRHLLTPAGSQQGGAGSSDPRISRPPPSAARPLLEARPDWRLKPVTLSAPRG
jgi:hypothetical protein